MDERIIELADNGPEVQIDYGDFEPPTVELIAAGYEWECPDCNAWNREIELPSAAIRCPVCGSRFLMSEYHHAFA